MSVAWSPDGRSLASASYDRTIRLWDRDGQWIRVLRGHGGPVESVAFSRDGTTLVSASADGTARRWHLDRLLAHGAGPIATRLVDATSATIDSDGRPATRLRSAPAW